MDPGRTTSVVALIGAAWLSSTACTGRRGLVSEGAAGTRDAAPLASADAGSDAANDSSVAAADAGVDARARDAGAVDALTATDAGTWPPPLTLGADCDVQLDRRSVPIVAGTLPASGPYHPCVTLGGQTLSHFAMSTDGTRFAALDMLGEAVVMDTTTLRQQRRFARARGPYTAVTLSPSGTVLAAGDEADGELDLFNVDDGTLIRAVDLGAAYSLYGGGLAFSRDAARVAATVGPDVAVVDVASGAVQRYTDGTRCCANAVVFADGGRKLATARFEYDPVGAGSPAVTLLDLASGALTTVFDEHDIYSWTDLVATGDGSTLLTVREGDGLRAWDGATGAPRPIFATTGLDIRRILAVDDRGETVALEVEDAASYKANEAHLQVRRLTDGTVLDEVHLPPGAGLVLWSPAGQRLVVTTGDGWSAFGLAVFDTAAGHSLARACTEPTGILPMAFASAAPRLLARASGGLRVYDAQSGEPVGPPLGPGELEDEMGISPDGRWVAWSSFIDPSGNAHVTLANAETGDQHVVGTWQKTYLGPTPSSGGSFVAVRDNGTGAVTVVDGMTGAPLATPPADLTKGMLLLGFSTDASALLLADGANVQAVDWRKGTVVPSGLGPRVVPPSAYATLGGDCLGGVPYTVFSANGARAAVGISCSRWWQLNVVPHVDLYDVPSGEPIQSVAGMWSDPLLSSDGAVIALDSGLWCL